MVSCGIVMMRRGLVLRLLGAFLCTNVKVLLG